MTAPAGKMEGEHARRIIGEGGSRIAMRCRDHRHLANRHRNPEVFASTHFWRSFDARQLNVQRRKGTTTYRIHTGKSIGSVTLTAMPLSWAV